MKNFYLYTKVDGHKRPTTVGANLGQSMAIDLMVIANDCSKSILKISCFHRSDSKNIIDLDIDGYPKTITLEYDRKEPT